MAFTAKAFDVTDEAQKIVDLGGLRTTIEIVNPSSNSLTVWVGASDVVIDDGRPVIPGESWAADLEGDDDVYIVASGAVTVFYSKVSK